MATTATDDGTGPLWTVLRLDVMQTGARRVLVRKRGGQLIQVYAYPSVTYGPALTDLIDSIVTAWPGRPADKER